jgi:hypothetical protein
MFTRAVVDSVGIGGESQKKQIQVNQTTKSTITTIWKTSMIEECQINKNILAGIGWNQESGRGKKGEQWA